MAHEITEIDEVATRLTPWHGLGTTLGRYMTSKEAMEHAKLAGWNVDLSPVYGRYADGTMYEVPGQYATIRTDINRHLGVVGDRYTIMQNEELFEFADALVDTGDAWYESAGSLKGNTMVFLSMKLARPIEVANIDFEPILTCATSHDGSLATQALISPIVVVCMNTLSLSVNRAKYRYQIRHTESYSDRLAEARLALQLSWKYFDGFEAEVQRLLDTDVTKKQFEDIVSELFPIGDTELRGKIADKRREALRHTYYSDPSSRPWVGSAWGVLNGVNTYELWESPIRVTSKVSDDRGLARLERHGEGFLRDNQTPLTKKAHKLLVEARP